MEKHIDYSSKFTKTEQLLQENQKLCDKIVTQALEFYQIERHELDDHVNKLKAEGKVADRISVSQTLKHIVRDWTEPGAAYERNACFSCLTKTMKSLFPSVTETTGPVRVLLPGAGLGRLGTEIADQGGQYQTSHSLSGIEI